MAVSGGIRENMPWNKGVPAALIMAALSALIRSAAMQKCEIDLLLAHDLESFLAGLGLDAVGP